MPVNKSEQYQKVSIAQHKRWARVENRTAETQPARDGLDRKFLDLVDPDRELEPAERAKRAKNARSAHFREMALKSAQVRRAVNAEEAPQSAEVDQIDAAEVDAA